MGSDMHPSLPRHLQASVADHLKNLLSAEPGGNWGASPQPPMINDLMQHHRLPSWLWTLPLWHGFPACSYLNWCRGRGWDWEGAHIEIKISQGIWGHWSKYASGVEALDTRVAICPSQGETAGACWQIKCHVYPCVPRGVCCWWPHDKDNEDSTFLRLAALDVLLNMGGCPRGGVEEEALELGWPKEAAGCRIFLSGDKMFLL